MAPPSEAPPDPLVTREAGPAALRGGVLRTGGYALSLLLAVASAPLLIRHLGVADFGRYTTVTALIALIGGLTEGGLNAVALREYSLLDGEARRRSIADLLGLRIVLTVLGVALAVAFAVVAGYDDPLVVGTIAAGAGLLVQSTQSLLVVPLQGELRFGWMTLIDLGRQVVTVALIVVLVLVGAGLLPFLLVSIPAGLVALAATARLVVGRISLRPAFRVARWWRLLADTLAYAAAVAVSAVYFRIALLGTSIMSTPEETGYYATAYRVVEIFVALPALLIGAAFPILARAGRDDAERFASAVRRIVELSVLVGAGWVVMIVLGAQVVIDVLAGDIGQPSVAVLQVQGVALLATFLANAGGFALLAQHRHRDMLASTAAALAASLALTLALVPPLDAMGAALAALGAETVLAVVVLERLARTRRGLLPAPRAVLEGLGVAGVAASVALIPGLPALADVVAATLVLGLGLHVVGRFPPEIRQLVARRGE